MGRENKENTKIEKEAKALSEKILGFLGYKPEISVEASEESVKIDINGEDLGLLIGQRGDHLESLQILLGLILNKKLGGEWLPVIVDVGGWRKEKEETLKALVNREVTKITSMGGETSLFPMTPTQRRTVHLLVSEYAGLESSSAGDEPNRYVIIKRVADKNGS